MGNNYIKNTPTCDIAIPEFQKTKMQYIAKKLDEMQSYENWGRGIDCIKTLIVYLNKGDFNGACAVASNEWDKISSYHQIAMFLMEEKIFVPYWFTDIQ